MENIQKKSDEKRLHLKSIITSGYNKACNGYIPIQAFIIIRNGSLHLPWH